MHSLPTNGLHSRGLFLKAWGQRCRGDKISARLAEVWAGCINVGNSPHIAATSLLQRMCVRAHGVVVVLGARAWQHLHGRRTGQSQRTISGRQELSFYGSDACSRRIKASARESRHSLNRRGQTVRRANRQ